MKFARDFQAALERDEYPQEWIDSAISYKKLKKCIKRVQQELLGLGLDQQTLESLWQHIGPSATTAMNGEASNPLMQYSFPDKDGVKFTPRLTIAIDPRDGSPMDAWLSPETRRVLRRFVKGNHLASRNYEEHAHLGEGIHQEEDHQHERVMHDTTADSPNGGSSDGDSADVLEHLETIEIPLTSDSEFFQILRRELANLDRLQEVEQAEIQSEIVRLGDDLRVMKNSKRRKSKEEIEAWREIFRMYNDAQIFLSSNEQDAGVRDASQAQRQLQLFTSMLAMERSRTLKLGKDAGFALERFLRINGNLLRLMKFQDINRIALFKIMKKFDKRTALHAQATVSETLSKAPFMAQDLAKATCFTISEEILHIIPQLDDYLCPICFTISYQPVRLRCNHVFCIRCLIVMQRARQDHCPLCRGGVVLEACGGKWALIPAVTSQANFLFRQPGQGLDGFHGKELQASCQGQAESQ